MGESGIANSVKIALPCQHFWVLLDGRLPNNSDPDYG